MTLYVVLKKYIVQAMIYEQSNLNKINIWTSNTIEIQQMTVFFQFVYFCSSAQRNTKSKAGQNYVRKLKCGSHSTWRVPYSFSKVWSVYKKRNYMSQYYNEQECTWIFISYMYIRCVYLIDYWMFMCLGRYSDT